MMILKIFVSSELQFGCLFGSKLAKFVINLRVARISNPGGSSECSRMAKRIFGTVSASSADTYNAHREAYMGLLTDEL